MCQYYLPSGLLNVENLPPLQDKGHNSGRSLTLCRDVSCGIAIRGEVERNNTMVTQACLGQKSISHKNDRVHYTHAGQELFLG